MNNSGSYSIQIIQNEELGIDSLVKTQKLYVFMGFHFFLAPLISLRSYA